mmetsp:Transcript_3273/g.6766  ORF Transcript_3273/g.6766 Transcript_3273/m.6766 type:complete len:86 (-) Transcript_3273:147-404(-)
MIGNLYQNICMVNVKAGSSKKGVALFIGSQANSVQIYKKGQRIQFNSNQVNSICHSTRGNLDEAIFSRIMETMQSVVGKSDSSKN